MTAKTMTRDEPASPAKQEFMTRSEGRRLFAMAVLLVVIFAWLLEATFNSGQPTPPSGVDVSIHPGAGPGPAPGEVPLHSGPYQDSRKVLEALRRSEAARASGAPVASATPFSFDPAVLQTADEGRRESVDVVEEPALYHLAALVHRMSDEELRAAPERRGTWDWTDLKDARARQAARGKFRTIQGRFLVPLWQRVLERYPNEADLVWVWQGILRVKNRGYFVTITDKNFEPRIGQTGTIVEIDAAFLKIHAYETEKGIKSYPHVIAKSFRKLEPPPPWDYMNSELIWGAVVAFVIAAILVTLYARGSRRSARQFDAWRHKRLTSKKPGAPKGAASSEAGPS